MNQNIFLKRSFKAKEIKLKINKWDLSKLITKNFINKMQRQPTERKKKLQKI